MAGNGDDQEAAWQDLVTRLAAPMTDGGTGPWPAREALPSVPEADGAETAGPEDPDAEPASTQGGAPHPRPPGLADTGMPGPDAAPGDPGVAPGPAHPAGRDIIPGVMPAPPQIRIIRPAVPGPIPAEDDDGHFVPPPPPPLPRLDPVSRGAWAALFGGPGYLLLAVMLGWVVPGWAAFTAVAAFIAGFAALVIRLGDRPPRDSGPDDGAVV